MKQWLILSLALAPLLATSVHAAARPSAEEEGQALACELRDQRPVEGLMTTGVLKLRGPEGRWRPPLPVRMTVVVGTNGWASSYEVIVSATNVNRGERLTVMHLDQQAPRYEYVAASTNDTGSPLSLQGGQAAVSFAGSDFWLMDLGLEFFHWPNQRLVKREMRKGRSCRVLQSVNPNPQPGSYARVLSWIDLETNGLLRAEAYDARDCLLKEFSIGSFKKVDKRWQLKSMEIRNEKTDARTRLEFDLNIE